LFFGVQIMATRGRKAHKRTEETIAKVSALKMFGHTDQEIGKHLGISDETLMKYYRVELDTASVEANMVIANKLYQKAKAGDLGAIIFWLKTRGKGMWREKDKDDKKFESIVEKLIDKATSK